MRKLIFLLLLGSLLLSACQSGQSGAVQTVENYYQALVDRDDARYAGYTCADWEAQALLEYDSFAGVEIALDEVVCREAGTQGEAALVACDGRIVATYGNEQMDFPLAERLHQVVNQNGEWLVCGY